MLLATVVWGESHDRLLTSGDHCSADDGLKMMLCVSKFMLRRSSRMILLVMGPDEEDDKVTNQIIICRKTCMPA